MKSKPLHYLIKVVILFLLYFLTAKYGLKVDAVSGFATLIWLPTGISLAALLILGIDFWPGIFLAAFAANLVTGAPPLVAISIGIGNTLEAVVAAYLLKRFFQFNNSLEKLRDVSSFIVIAAFFCTMISATIGVVSLLLGQVIAPAAIFSTWTAWWVGDMISNLIVAPVLLVWSYPFSHTFPIRTAARTVLLYIMLIFVGLMLFKLDTFRDSHLTYMVFPPLILIALRFSQRQVVTAMAMFSVISILGTIYGGGPFVRGDVSASLLDLQSFMGIVSVTMMVLSAVVSERRQLEKQKDDFISIASHELKTPITTVKAYVQIMKRTTTKTTMKNSTEYLQKMDDQLSKLMILVNDLLDLSRIQAGKLAFNKETFRLDELIKEAAERVQLIHKTHKIVLKKIKATKIYGDKDRLGQVFTNLLMNAVKYSPDAKEVVVSAKKIDDSVIISIKDFGIGIADEYHEKVFEHFYRINDTNKGFPGTGIGLYISKSIIENHGGKIWLESKLGEGTTFFVLLPIHGEKI